MIYKGAVRLLFLFLLVLPGFAWAQTPASEFVFRPGDRVRISVWPDSSLNGEFPIEEDGIAYLPMLGKMKIAGTPLSALRSSLTDRLTQMMKDPVVSVVPVFKVSVLGAVVRPGLYDADPTKTVFDLISVAGGFRPEAKVGHVRIIRDGSSREMNFDDVLKGKGRFNDVAAQSGDRIVVPESRMPRAQTVFFIAQSVFMAVTLITRL